MDELGAVRTEFIEASMNYAVTLLHSHGGEEHSHVYEQIPHSHPEPKPPT
jgi:hypothetical protein